MPQDTRLAELGDERLTAADKGLPERAAGLTVREFLATSPRLAEFWTPLLALDERALAINTGVIQGWCLERGLELMPHGKTTMAPALWQRQLDAGAVGLTLATPGQVRTARSFGVASIMLANTVVAPAALAFIADELADPGFAFRAWVDSVESVEAMEHGLAGLPTPLPRRIDVLVELGGAGGRTGARGVPAAARVAERVAASPVLRLAGTAGYEGSLGHDRSSEALAAVRGYLAEMLELHDIVREFAEGGTGDGDGTAADRDGTRGLIVTAGGSAYLDLVAEVFAPAITAAAAAGDGTRWILRSGASLLHDDGFYRGISPLDAELTPAMRGYARVVSHPEPGLALLDGGKRDFPYDEGLPVPFGVAGAPGAGERPLAGASVSALNDQHAYLRSSSALPIVIGDVVSLGLSHPCTAFDKWRFIPVVEGDGSDRVVELVRTFF